MPYTIPQLLTGLDEPVTADPDESIQAALNRMLEKDYSQLPVVEGAGQSARFYLITSGSVLTALSSFGLKTNTKELRVRDALRRVSHVFSLEDDVFDLMKGVEADGAALVVSDDRRLIHIVTSYDTTNYFRRWAEDIIYARDVEDSLKRYINAAFKTADGALDEAARQQAIDDIMSSNRDMRRKFNRAFGRYLKQQSIAGAVLNAQWSGEAFLNLLGSSPNRAATPDGAGGLEAAAAPSVGSQANDLLSAGEVLRLRFEKALSCYLSLQAVAEPAPKVDWLEDAFLEMLNPGERPRHFKELTLDNLIKLFLSDQCWLRCCAVLRFDKDAVRLMLEGVRDTRNKLAHFREEEISIDNRLQLKQCADWLFGHEKEAVVALEESAPAPVASSPVASPMVAQQDAGAI